MRNPCKVLAFWVCTLLFANQSFAQRIVIERLDTLSEPIVRNYSMSSNLLQVHNNELYWLHSCRESMGLEYDSVILFKVRAGKLTYLQVLKLPKEMATSGFLSLIVSDTMLAIVNYRGLMLFKREKGKFRFEKFIKSTGFGDSVEYELRSFEKFHVTKAGIYSTDFAEDYRMSGRMEGSCRDMFIGKINQYTLQLEDSFRLKTCGLFTAGLNSTYPLDFSPSGEVLAYADVLKNKVYLYRVMPRKLEEFYNQDVSDSSWKLINNDSMDLWTYHNESNHKLRRESDNKRGRHFFSSTTINRLLFLDDSTLFISAWKNSKILNIPSLELRNVSGFEELDSSMIYLSAHDIIANKGEIYKVVFHYKFREYSAKTGRPQYDPVAWRIAQLGIDYGDTKSKRKRLKKKR